MGDRIVLGAGVRDPSGDKGKFIDCFRERLALSSRWHVQKHRPPAADSPLSLVNDLACDGLRKIRDDSSLDSSRVALCTKVSAVSHTKSEMASLGSILSKCCRMLRNGIS